MYSQMLQVIALDIEGQLNARPGAKQIKVEKFIMIYTHNSTTVQFQLNDNPEKIPVIQPELANGMRMLIEPEIKDPYELTYALIFWYGPDAKAKIGIHGKHKITREKYADSKDLD